MSFLVLPLKDTLIKKINIKKNPALLKTNLNTVRRLNDQSIYSKNQVNSTYPFFVLIKFKNKVTKHGIIYIHLFAVAFC